MEQSAETGLEVSVTGSVLHLVLARPAAGNSVNRTMVNAMCDVLRDVAERTDVRVIALSARGKDFCTGIDLKEANARGDARPRVGNHQRRIESGVNQLVRALADVQMPVVCAVRGWAVGVGMSLALLSDYIVCAPTTRFWAPFTSRGFSPDSGSSYLLPRLVGLARAKEMILLGRQIDASTAESWGMVNKVVDDTELEAAFNTAVAEFAGRATVAVGLAKALLRRNLDTDLAQALSNEAFAEEVSLRSADFKAGIKAFLAREDASFTGL